MEPDYFHLAGYIAMTLAVCAALLNLSIAGLVWWGRKYRGWRHL